MNDPARLRLCLDFGTAFCKAAVCVRGQAPTPLRIGAAAGEDTANPADANERNYMLETAVAISASARVYFGGRAMAVTDGNTRVLQAIKDPLTSAGGSQDLDRLLPRQFNPTSLNVSRRDVIVLYLAFLTQAALEAWSANGRIDRSVVRGLTIPAFEAAKVAWVNAELRSLLAQAEFVGRQFGRRLFEDVPLREALECLVHARQTGVHRDLVADSTTEPIAAFAARLLHFTPQNQRLGNVIMVVDIGAGTTDFALFASGLKDGRMRVRHIKHSHRSLAVAGNAIDDALVHHVLSGAQIGEGSHVDAIRTDLERGGGFVRGLKEDLFRDRVKTIVFDQTTLELRLDEFLASVAMQRIIGQIKGAFDAVLQEVLPARRGGRVVVYFSGGGAGLPFLKQFLPVSETSFTHRDTGRSGLVRLMEPRDPRPSWHDQLGYESLWHACGGNRQPPNQDFFGRLAVALGGAYFAADAQDWLHLDRTMLWPMVTREAELLRAPQPG